MIIEERIPSPEGHTPVYFDPGTCLRLIKSRQFPEAVGQYYISTNDTEVVVNMVSGGIVRFDNEDVFVKVDSKVVILTGF